MNADLFQHICWGTPTEIERRRRIRLSVWAYAYEIAGSSLVDDATFDREAYTCDPTIATGHLDEWWRTFFARHTGQWIYGHPEMDKLAKLYQRLTAC